MITTRMSSNTLASRIAGNLVQQQAELAEAQSRISTGKRVISPSDDPSSAAHILRMQEAESQLEQYQRNSTIAESQLSLEEAALSGVNNTLLRIRELALTANSGAVDDTTRAAHEAEVALRLEELYDLANTRDSLGNYLFSGTHSRTRPFTREPAVQYNGSDNALMMQVGLGRTIQTGDSGAEAFMRVRNGNGTFQVELDAANTGTGNISFGSVVDRSAYQAEAYRIEFTTANSFNVVDDAGTVIQAGNSYVDGTDVQFNGISTHITGSPAGGDVFHVSPSRQQDIFTTVSRFINALQSSPSTPAEKAVMQQEIVNVIGNIDQSLEHVNTTRARVGTRLNTIENSREENADIKLQLQGTRAEVEDIDIAEAVTNLQSKLTSLQVLQQTYSRVESLSLFNYL